MVSSMCVFNAFLMCFRPEFQSSWADFEKAVLAYPNRTVDTVSGLKIVMHANSKRFIHTLPTDMFFDLE